MVLTDFEQFVSASSGLVLKPAHMIISAIILSKLRGMNSEPLRAFKAAFASLLVGEGACAANYIIANHGILVLDIVHDAGMIAFGIFLPFGLFIWFEDEILNMSTFERPCLMLKACGKCWKGAGTSCRLRGMMLLASMALTVLSAVPVSTPVVEVKEHGLVFGSGVNFGINHSLQFLEYRIYPVMALSFSTASMFLLFKGKVITKIAALLFFTGAGFLMYSMVRISFIEAFRTVPYWADFWEEATELIAVVGSAYIIYAFRDRLPTSVRAIRDAR